MLRATAAVNRAYCRRHRIEYRQFIGVKRGFFPWHATFNRIILLQEMLAAGFTGWLFYLDADAYVVDLSFDVRRLIADIGKPIIMAPGGRTGEKWDVNVGVFLADLGSEIARDLMLAWHADFMMVSEESLRTMHNWPADDLGADQPRMHSILQKSQRFQDAIGLADRYILNDRSASFVRQILRAYPGGWEER